VALCHDVFPLQVGVVTRYDFRRH